MADEGSASQDTGHLDALVDSVFNPESGGDAGHDMPSAEPPPPNAAPSPASAAEPAASAPATQEEAPPSILDEIAQSIRTSILGETPPADPPALTAAERQQQFIDNLSNGIAQGFQQWQPPTQPAQPAVQPQEPLTADQVMGQLTQRYAGQAESLAAQGLLSAERLQLDPQGVYQELYQREVLGNLAQQVSQISEHLQGQQFTAQQNDVIGTITNTFDQLADQGGIFEGLNDDDIREEVGAYLLQINPQQSVLTPEFIARQYIAMNAETILEALEGRQQAGQTKAPDLTMTERPGARSAPEPPKTDFEENASDLFDLAVEDGLLAG